MGRVEVTYSKRATLVTAIEVGSWYLKFRCIEAEVVDVVGEQGRRSRNVSTGVFSDKIRLREPTQLCVRDYQRISNSKSFNLYPLLSRALNAITFHPIYFWLICSQPHINFVCSIDWIKHDVFLSIYSRVRYNKARIQPRWLFQICSISMPWSGFPLINRPSFR